DLRVADVRHRQGSWWPHEGRLTLQAYWLLPARCALARLHSSREKDTRCVYHRGDPPWRPIHHQPFSITGRRSDEPSRSRGKVQTRTTGNPERGVSLRRKAFRPSSAMGAPAARAHQKTPQGARTRYSPTKEGRLF